ncbi:hypothetical protein ABIE50_003977 [Chitinophaga sp. OAE865]
MHTAYLYIHVNTDEQAVKGYSMRNQEEQLIRFCQVNCNFDPSNHSRRPFR